MRSLAAVLVVFGLLLGGAELFEGGNSPAIARADPFTHSQRILTGVASTAADYGKWDAAFGGRLSIRLTFQSWSFNTPPAKVLHGPGIPMISWQPWKPTASTVTAREQGAAQPKYSNAAIANGKWDGYIKRWAEAIKAYGGPVIMRPMHEFNGFWYPWSHDPKEYVLAWRHIWNLFHRVGADNVTWIWSFQALYSQKRWAADVAKYWPGRKYVNILGMSLDHFPDSSPPSDYLAYLRLAHRIYHLPTMITEANVNFGLRTSWLKQVVTLLRPMRFNEGFIWSQLKSLEQRNPHESSFGNMNWSALKYPAVQVQLRRIAALPF